jgi:sortase A
LTNSSGTVSDNATHVTASPARRRMLPISGLMIIFGVLMLGAALAIPATRAIQEAQLRDRIAAFSGGEQQSPNDPGDASNLPAYLEIDDADTQSGSSDAVAPGRDSDVATILDQLRSGAQLEPPEAVEPEAVEMPPPSHIRIPGVEIDTNIIQVTSQITEIEGQRVREWDVAAYAAGHHDTSARPGEGGNIVITGHNDWEGEVFRTLEYVEPGYDVFIQTEDRVHHYVVEEVHMRREVGVSLEERLATGQFMADMPEERVTLITCWPYGINDHRVIVVAKPVDS